MTTTAPTTPDKPPRPIPGRIGAVLRVVHSLIAYGRHFTATAQTRVAKPEFATAAAIFGTYDLPLILLRMRRGILRALALQRYLLDRAARGSNLRFEWPPFITPLPHQRPPARPPRKRPENPLKPRKDPALLGPDDPAAYHLPTPEELDADVRRRPVGRTITLICLDLGIAPGLCLGDFWYRLERTLRRYGGSIHPLYDVRAVREKSFQKERDRLPDTWHIDWRDQSHSTVRQALGCLIGETPPADELMSGLPEPVHS